MRVNSNQCHPKVTVDRAMTRPVTVVLFGSPGLRLMLSTEEAIRFANQLVDAAEQADEDRTTKAVGTSTTATELENDNG